MQIQEIYSSDNSDFENESTSDSNSDDGDADKELLAAFISNLIKPGTINMKTRKKDKINNTEAILNFNKNLRELITEEILNDFTEIPAITIPVDENRINDASEHVNKVKQNLANDDFKREALFAMEAKSSIILGLELFKTLDIATTRPTDFYAEMTKNDKQMEKVKTKIIKKTEEQDRREKLRNLR